MPRAASSLLEFRDGCGPGSPLEGEWLLKPTQLGPRERQGSRSVDVETHDYFISLFLIAERLNNADPELCVEHRVPNTPRSSARFRIPKPRRHDRYVTELVQRRSALLESNAREEHPTGHLPRGELLVMSSSSSRTSASSEAACMASASTVDRMRASRWRSLTAAIRRTGSSRCSLGSRFLSSPSFRTSDSNGSSDCQLDR